VCEIQTKKENMSIIMLTLSENDTLYVIRFDGIELVEFMKGEILSNFMPNVVQMQM